MKILVASCDKNKDLFEPFHHCMEKYWPGHPEIIYSTESIANPFYKTIVNNYDLEHWTDRVRETAKQIDDNNILFMVDDVFIRNNVNNDYISSLCKYLVGKYANINLQLNGDRKAIPISEDLLERSPGKWNLCCMCTLWQKRAMIDLFDYSSDPWKFEENNYIKDYKFLISKTGNIINWGRKSNKEWHWGIMKGKWVMECVKFMIQEGLDKDIDFLKRGIFYPEASRHFMQLAGDCSCMGYLGNNRLRGPIDNVVTKGAACVESLLNDKYYEQVTTAIPTIRPRKPQFDGDSYTIYDFDIVQIVHNNISDTKYKDELKARCVLFKDFYNRVLTEDGFYFTINFNMFDLSAGNEEIANNIESIIKVLVDHSILNKVLFVGLKATQSGYGNRHPVNIDHYIKKYQIKYIEITNNNIWKPSEIDRCYIQFLSQL